MQRCALGRVISLAPPTSARQHHTYYSRRSPINNSSNHVWILSNCTIAKYTRRVLKRFAICQQIHFYLHIDECEDLLGRGGVRSGAFASCQMADFRRNRCMCSSHRCNFNLQSLLLSCQSCAHDVSALLILLLFILLILLDVGCCCRCRYYSAVDLHKSNGIGLNRQRIQQMVLNSLETNRNSQTIQS